MLASDFIEKRFDPACRPDERTVRAWVRAGILAGREIGRRVYIDDAAFMAETGNALADKILVGAGKK